MRLSYSNIFHFTGNFCRHFFEVDQSTSNSLVQHYAVISGENLRLVVQLQYLTVYEISFPYNILLNVANQGVFDIFIKNVLQANAPI